MGPETLVEVSNLHRRYGDIHAVKGVSFEVHRGEVLGLLGPNGAGKTTTMNLVSGVLAPTEGSVRIAGTDLVAQPLDAKRRLGYLPEQPPLHRELTVDEYLGFCARLRRLGRAPRTAAVTEAKVRCGLQDCGRRLLGNLSKGFRQRVGIAQAILHRPAVVILDEPTAGLDPIQIREIRALVRELGAEHGIILSTHILPEVQATCDRVQIIHEGRLVLDERMEHLAGAGAETFTRAAFRRPPAAESLRQLPGVASVEALDGHLFRLYHDPQDALPERLVAASVDGDWGLYELVTERRSLEEIFVEVTTSEVEAASAAPGEQARNVTVATL